MTTQVAYAIPHTLPQATAAGSPAVPLHITLRDVQMEYSDRSVFQSLSAGFPKGQISVILGSSGSGKSTILRLIGGLIHPQSGEILVDGDDVTKLSGRALFSMRQKLGMVFQGGALLDSYTVFDNLALPLREQTRLSRDQIRDEVHAALDAVGVTRVDRLLPGQLSGGMLRRVALARAIIRKPTILLCDEPFSGLDPVSIRRIEALLVNINRQFGMTLIVVSHHIPSTLRMANHALLLLHGRAIEGTPTSLRHHPDPEISEFLNDGLDSPAH